MRKRTKEVAWGGAILAAGLGYVVGLLTAPKSGKETRGEIEHAAVKAKREAEKALKALHSELASLIRQAKKVKGKREFTKAINEAEGAKERVREILSALHEGESHSQDLQKAIEDVNNSLEHLKKYIQKA